MKHIKCPRHNVPKYKMPNNEEELQDIIRKFPTDSILKRINRESNKIKESDFSCNGVVPLCLNTIQSATGEVSQWETYEKAWDLLDLAYYAVKYSNDYRGELLSDETFSFLCVLPDHINEKREAPIIESMKGNHTLFMQYLWGFAGEQFKYQNLNRVMSNARREFYILQNYGGELLNQYFENCSIGCTENCKPEDVICVLLMAICGFMKFDTLSEIEENTLFVNSSKQKMFSEIISYYTADYNTIRNSAMGRQFFYTKPFIRTQRGEVVSLGPYTNCFAYEHCLFWLLRDYCRNNYKNQEFFPSFFGGCFESYFEEVLSDCLYDGEFRRIEEGNSKRADWFLEIEGYKFIVEQKSSIIALSAKQALTDINAVQSHIKRVALESIEQLYETESALDGSKFIKIILVYEDYLVTNILDTVFEMPECKISNDHYYWMMTIDEMESLLYLRKEKPDAFKAIIAEKIHREETDFNGGKAIDQILSSFNEHNNNYIESEKFKRFSEHIFEHMKTYVH